MPSDGGATGSAGMVVTVPAARGAAGRDALRHRSGRSLSPGRGASTHPARGPSPRALSPPAYAVDVVQVPRAAFVVHHAQTRLRRQRQDADLALVGVGVDV